MSLEPDITTYLVWDWVEAIRPRRRQQIGQGHIIGLARPMMSCDTGKDRDKESAGIGYLL